MRTSRLVLSLMLIFAAIPAVSAQDTAQSVLDGVFTEDQATRGETVYKEHCTTCHGGNLRGTPGAPAILGSAFKRNWVGLSLGDLYGFIQSAMPAGQGGTLSDQQYIDVVAFILSKGKFPAGAEELTPDLEALSQVGIVEAP